MAFSFIVGQQYAKERLGKLLCGEPGHAYVFCGPTGIGKTLLAKEFAKGLLCQNPSSDGGCGVCPDCRYIAEGTHPDFRMLMIPNGEKGIKVADVRSRIGSDVNIMPQIAKRKVYLIEADGLNEEGQNALLKTLEEPPSYAVFILEISDSAKLLPTIMSRVVTVTLHLNTQAEVMQILSSSLSLEKEQEIFYARYANGIPGEAVKLAQSPWFSELRDETIDYLLSIPYASKSELLTSGYAFFESNKDHINEMLKIMLFVFRDMAILLSESDPAFLPSTDKRDKIENVISQKKLGVPGVTKAAAAVEYASRALTANCSFESTICQMLLSIQEGVS